MKTATLTLISGANTQQIDLPDEPITIGDIIARYATVMNIPDGKREVRLNGKPATETDSVNEGDSVEVIREAGSKG